MILVPFPSSRQQQNRTDFSSRKEDTGEFNFFDNACAAGHSALLSRLKVQLPYFRTDILGCTHVQRNTCNDTMHRSKLTALSFYCVISRSTSRLLLKNFCGPNFSFRKHLVRVAERLAPVSHLRIIAVKE